MAPSFAVLPWEKMALETVPKDLRHLRACLLCSLVKVSVGNLVVRAMEDQAGGKWVEQGYRNSEERSQVQDPGGGRGTWEAAGGHRLSR